MRPRYLLFVAAAVALVGCGSTAPAAQTVTSTVTTTETVTVTPAQDPSTAASTSSSSSAAPSSSSSPGDGDSGSGAVGQALPVEWREGKGTVTINEYRWADKAEYFTPKNGAFLSVDVTYEATEGTVSYNFYNWSAKDSESREYNADIPVVEPSLQSGDLPTGEKVRGWITFDVPQGATVLSIDDIIDGDLARWDIPAA